ncbi:MAG: T9SS type A sorting domain-containing protein [Flavobacteriales bacterium]|nr:T9SS type A sorting domain-containing protein [Flavobacteriales bacterium]
MSVGTPTSVGGAAPAVYNPAGILNTDITRVSISHNPLNPITAPLSLLHLGYGVLNTPGPGVPPTPLTFGWRPWMDVGMFVASNQSDYVYLGLKNETGNTVSNRQDAVLAWGDDPSGTNGPDNLRFIFTSPTTATQSPANTTNGLEVARMVPNTATTLAAPNSGMMGIGDFSPSSPNATAANQVNAKLDIDGDLRIRTVTPDNTLTQVLVIDPTDKNRVHYRSIPNLSGSGQGFFACSNTSTAPNLTSDSKINLNNNNLYFENNGVLGENHIGVGYNCANTLPGKLSVFQTHPLTVNTNTIAISGINSDVSNTISTKHIGVEGLANGIQTVNKVMNIGGEFSALNSQDTRGIVARIPASNNNTLSATAGDFLVLANSQTNTGIRTQASGAGVSTSRNIGISSLAFGSQGNNSGGDFSALSGIYPNSTNTGISASAEGSQISNIAGKFQVIGGPNNLPNNPTPNPSLNIAVAGQVRNQAPYTFATNVNIGIYGNCVASNFGKVGYAGFFDGNVWINGPAVATGFAATTSDQNFKTDVNPITNATGILSQLHPKTFYFDTLNPYGFNFSNRKQYGLLAQEVETVMPELVSDEYKPATVDSTGTIVTQGVNYKALNYDAFISILIKGHQEQKDKIDSLQLNVNNRDSIINNLNDRLAHLENCLSGILPFLCQISNSAIQPTQEVFQEQLKNEINVQLSNKGTIILNQNVPNPFAEQTQISFSIPETVKKAQIHFYDANGKLINSVDVLERGLGQLNVFANDLSTGVYTYTLVADGQIVATKKMMKQ